MSTIGLKSILDNIIDCVQGSRVPKVVRRDYSQLSSNIGHFTTTPNRKKWEIMTDY